MSEIAVEIIDPAGEHHARLLDDDKPVKDVLPPLVKKLELPESVNYQLVPKETGKPLSEKETLSGAGIKAGAELELKAVRDRLLTTFLDALYVEIEEETVAEAWEAANERLQTLLRLDPSHPDPKGLGRAIETRTPISGPAPAAPPPVAAPAGAPPAPTPTPPAPQPTTGGAGAGNLLRRGCIGVAVLGGLGVLAVLVIVVLGLLPDAGIPATDGPDSGGQFLPPEIELGTGDVQVTVQWNSAADIDLHVIDPDGEEIYFVNTTSQSGGELDVDANAGCGSQMPRPVENVFWPRGGAPRGSYQVSVVYFAECEGSGATDYQVTIKLNEQVFDTIRGTLAQDDDERRVSTFTY